MGSGWVKWFVVVSLCAGTGCLYVARVETQQAKARLLRARANLAEQLDACLKRKANEPTLDCTTYIHAAGAASILVQPAPTFPPASYHAPLQPKHEGVVPPVNP